MQQLVFTAIMVGMLAWVLWSTSNDGIRINLPINGYEIYKDCEKALGEIVGHSGVVYSRDGRHFTTLKVDGHTVTAIPSDKNMKPSKLSYTCLPDDIDPRSK